MILILRYLIIITLLFSFCGCDQVEKNRNWNAPSGKIKVLTTIAMISDLASEIGGEYVETHSLITGCLDPHSYELVKGDDEKFARADLVFYNGLGLEHGASLVRLLKQHPHARGLGDFLVENHRDLLLEKEGTFDPHIWMDISLWAKIIDPIVQELSKIDPDHTTEYQERGRLLSQKMKEADEMAYAKLQSIPQEKRYLVTSHDAFHYFTKRYLADASDGSSWECRSKAPEGLSPEAQASFSDLECVINHLLTYRIGVIFPESNLNTDSLVKIEDVCLAKGFTVRLAKEELYADSMGKEASYLEMIFHNVNAIVEELSK